jgi:prevent-host-death family protein
VNVSVAEAKNKLTQLLQAVEKGERITICRHGQPVADLIPSQSNERKARIFGSGKGKTIILDPDWAKPQNDLESWLEGDV